MQLQPNTLFHNHYNLVRLIGRGGFSEVWLAKDKYTELDLALKIYAPNGGLDDNGIQAFSGEIRRVYNLNHPSLLKAQHFDVCDGMPYLVMPYCANGSVTKQVGKMTEPEVWHLLHDVAAGLAYLHENNIVHQDIKPDNIMQDTNGHYLITDFGISARTRATLTKTQSASNLGSGTAAYMAPERFSTNPLPTFASDVWALGATVYELIVGTVPFGDGSLPGGLLQKNGAEIPDISTNSTPTISEKLASVILQMLSVNPWDRPTADTLATWAADPLKVAGDDNGEKKPIVSSRPTVAHMTPMPQTDTPNVQPQTKKDDKVVWWLIFILMCASIIVVVVVGSADTYQKQSSITTYTDTTMLAPPAATSSNKKTQTATEEVVVEEPKPQYTISLSESDLTAVYQGGYIYIDIETSSPTWKYKNKPSWCTITKYSDSFRLTVNENTTDQQRTAKIKFYVDGDSKILKITQEAAPYTSTESIDDNRTNNYTSNRTFTANGVSFTMVYVQGGTFTMGAHANQEAEAWDNEKPAHSVTLSRYYIGETEVTQALWSAVMGYNPSHSNQGGNYPVEQVSYNDCKTFIRELSRITGQNFRLPTEAEWEFAARGGNKSRGYKYAGSNDIGSVAWYYGNSDSHTHPVKTKASNELGLYDMSGNVWEWCNDWYGNYSSYSQTNPQGSNSGSYRVYRGGSWGSVACGCRSSYRYFIDPVLGYYFLGLRLVL